MNRKNFFRWYAFASLCFVVFLFLRFPDTRIKAYVLGVLVQEAQNQGLILDVDGPVRLSFFPFPGLTLERIRLKSLKNGHQGELKSAEADLALGALLLGKLGGRVRLKQEKGHLDVMISGRGTALSMQFEAQAFDLQVLPLISMASPVQLTCLLSGTGLLKGQGPESLEGEVHLNLQHIDIPAQSIFGFRVPHSSVRTGEFKVLFEGKKVVFQKAQLGAFGSADDVVAHLDQGSVTLGRNLVQSELDLKVRFQLSSNILGAFPFLESLLKNAQRSDQSYGYILKGPVMGLQPQAWKE
jgi:type II secretion system protein N